MLQEWTASCICETVMGVGQTSLDASSGAAEGTCALGAWERPRGGSGPPGGGCFLLACPRGRDAARGGCPLGLVGSGLHRPEHCLGFPGVSFLRLCPRTFKKKRLEGSFKNEVIVFFF